jgi:hypothetical protein
MTNTQLSDIQEDFSNPFGDIENEKRHVGGIADFADAVKASSFLAGSEQSINMAEKCSFRPTIDEILTDIFGAYDFYLDGDRMHPAEVFSPSSFLPLFSAIAINRTESLFGFPLYVEEIEDEDAIFGIMVSPAFPTAAPFVLYALQLASVIEDVVGKEPCRIDLDDLYAYGTSEEMQQAGLPFLGKP